MDREVWPEENERFQKAKQYLGVEDDAETDEVLLRAIMRLKILEEYVGTLEKCIESIISERCDNE